MNKSTLTPFLFLALLPGAALAQDAIEAAYNKYHRAAVMGNIEEAAKYATAARQKEMTGLAGEVRTGAVKMLGSNMPRAYLVASKTVSPTGRTAFMLASGPGDSTGYGGAKPMYGSIRMTLEGADWKVIEASWSPEKPPGFEATQASAKPKPAAAPPQPGRETFATKGPTFKLGVQKEPCVFKPVMTAEDLERCK